MVITEAPKQSQRIGLALSGGGIRAAVFHLGVLRRIAKAGLLEQVSHISSVSGGSLIVGAIFAHSGMNWPSSEQYLHKVYPELKALLTEGDLFSFRALGLKGLVRHGPRLFFARAAILSWLLQKRWNVESLLNDLPAKPVWYINTTSLETGKNWRFSKEEMGDWVFGRHYSPKARISDAIAASAAVPYVIGALKFKLPKEGWWETNPATREPRKPKEPGSRYVRLWDGGAYENLGLEALFKPGDGLRGCSFLICSDASGPLLRPARFPVLGLLRGKLTSPRLFDIASDQIRALRSRMFLNAIQKEGLPGILIKMGVSERKLRIDLSSGATEKFLAAPVGSYLSDQICERCLNYPTNLTAISSEDFDALARHGFEIADGTLSAYAKQIGDQREFWRN